MKSYILTKKEREVIRKYLETGEKDKSIYVYLLRAKRYFPQLLVDLDLLKMLLGSKFQ